MIARICHSGIEIACNIQVAESLVSRMVGLLGRSRLNHGEGLLIKPCNGIHTFFMRFPIDVLFLDQNNRILRQYHSLPPNRFTSICREAKSVLELPAGTIDMARLEQGDHLKFT
jgi:uncharacterized protein